jgi:hypothetical protein
MHGFSMAMALGGALVLSTMAPGSVLAQGYGAMPAGSYQQSCTNVRVRGTTLPRAAPTTAARGSARRSMLTAVPEPTSAVVGQFH